jgi:Glyoxalase-like domain
VTENTIGYMALTWKLVIDSANASTLADFWAEALDYEVEDPSALIKQPLAAGRIGAESVVAHRGRTTFRGYAAIRHPDDSFDQISGVGRGRRLLFQDVPEGKSCKNRLHIDIHGEPGGLDKLVARLNSSGRPASARSTRHLPGTGGSCRTPKATSSARRRPGGAPSCRHCR